MYKIKRAIYRFLLPLVSKWENRMWRELYARPRKFCKCLNKKDCK